MIGLYDYWTLNSFYVDHNMFGKNVDLPINSILKTNLLLIHSVLFSFIIDIIIIIIKLNLLISWNWMKYIFIENYCLTLKINRKTIPKLIKSKTWLDQLKTNNST